MAIKKNFSHLLSQTIGYENTRIFINIVSGVWVRALHVCDLSMSAIHCDCININMHHIRAFAFLWHSWQTTNKHFSINIIMVALAIRQRVGRIQAQRQCSQPSAVDVAPPPQHLQINSIKWKVKCNTLRLVMMMIRKMWYIFSSGRSTTIFSRWRRRSYTLLLNTIHIYICMDLA